MKRRNLGDSSEHSYDPEQTLTIRWNSCPEMWAEQVLSSLMDFDELEGN